MAGKPIFHKSLPITPLPRSVASCWLIGTHLLHHLLLLVDERSLAHRHRSLARFFPFFGPGLVHRSPPPPPSRIEHRRHQRRWPISLAPLHQSHSDTPCPQMK